MASGPSIVGQVRQRIREVLPLGSLRARFAHGAFWSLVGTGVSQTFGLIASVIIARCLGKEGFGEFGMIQATVSMVALFAGMGLGITSTKYVAQLRTVDPPRAGRIIAFVGMAAWISSAAVSLGVWFLAPFLAANVINAPHILYEVRVSTLLMLFSTVSGVQIGVLCGLESFRSVAQVNFAKGLTYCLLVSGGVWVWDLRGAVWGTVAAAVAACFIGFLAIRRECKAKGIPISRRGLRGELPVLWQFSLPAVASGMLLLPTEWIMNAVVANIPQGYEQLGVFNAARQWYSIILFLPGILVQITLPMLSNLWGEGKLRHYRKLLVVNSALLTGLAGAVVVFVLIFRRAAMGMYGSGFAEYSLVLVLMCARGIIAQPNTVVGQAIWSIGASKAAMVLAMFRNIVLLSIFAFLYRRGAMGMALSLASCDFILLVVQVFYMRRRFEGASAAFPVAAVADGGTVNQ
jgi:O-antigen/teichoic acid export membrane protein